MPYSTSDPPKFLKGQPKGLIRLFVDAFNAVIRDGGTEDAARKAGWANAKRKYQKGAEGKWVPKSLAELSMFITKAVKGGDGVMRFKATASDTGKDLLDEQMSLPLYQSFIAASSGDKEKPFVSVAHYSRDAGDAGEVTELYIDGNKLKAKGFFYDTPLGVAAFTSIRSDIEQFVPDDRRIRISIGFWDWAHKHGMQKFERKSLTDLCPMCMAGLGDKVYMRGVLDHLALTRVPVCTRTPIEAYLEVKSMPKLKTRKADAASIVGEALADELETSEKARVSRSEVDDEETAALVTRGDEDDAVDETDEIEEVEEAAPAPVVESAAATEEKAQVVAVDPGEVVQVQVVENTYLPYGGATSIKDAKAYDDAREKQWKVQSAWWLLQDIISNIMNSAAVTDKAAAIKNALAEAQGLLEMKALTYLEGLQEQKSLASTAAVVEPDELEQKFLAVRSAMSEALSLPEGERAASVQPSFNELAGAITAALNKKSSENASPEAQETQTNADLAQMIRSAVSDAILPISKQVAQLMQAKEKPSLAEPVRRSVSATPAFTAYPVPGVEKKGKLRADVERSVGLGDAANPLTL